MGDIKTIDVKEFVEMGFLQEANRQFFHPLGLALSVNVEWPENCSEEEKEKYNNNVYKHPNSVWSLGSVWDYRKDDEGMLFGEGMIDKNKFLRVNTLRESKIVYRSRLPECNEEGIQRVEEEKEVINIKPFEKIFEDFPDLKELPIYSWGRYYKYELAGESFETFADERGFAKYAREEDEENIGLDQKLLSKIDEKLRKGEYASIFREVGYPDRDECAEKYDFDGRGGCMLVIAKEDGKLVLQCFDCDSPE